MKKINNKGLSIVELIISISLILIVMLFMFRLINQISYEKNNNYIAFNNQEIRIEIIDAIEELLEKIEVSSIITNDNSIKFVNSSNRVLYTIVVQNDIISIYDKEVLSNPLNKWIINDGTFGSLNCKYNEKNKLYSCSFPIYTSNVDNNSLFVDHKIINNNNTLDDIVFGVRLNS